MGIAPFIFPFFHSLIGANEPFATLHLLDTQIQMQIIVPRFNFSDPIIHMFKTDDAIANSALFRPVDILYQQYPR